MKKSVLIILILSFSAIFIGNAQKADIGSSWTIKHPGVRSSKHMVVKGDAIYTQLSKRQKAIVFEESMINAIKYRNRVLEMVNIANEDIEYSFELKPGQLNVVSFPLKPLKKKYKDDLNDQVFVIYEYADELESSMFSKYAYRFPTIENKEE